MSGLTAAMAAVLSCEHISAGGAVFATKRLRNFSRLLGAAFFFFLITKKKFNNFQRTR